MSTARVPTSRATRFFVGSKSLVCRSKVRNVCGARITSPAAERLVEAERKLRELLRTGKNSPARSAVEDLRLEIEELKKEVERDASVVDSDAFDASQEKNQNHLYLELETENELLRAKLKEKIESAKEKGQVVSEDLLTSLEMLQIQADKHALQRKIQDMLHNEPGHVMDQERIESSSSQEEREKYEELQALLKDTVDRIRDNVLKHQERRQEKSTSGSGTSKTEKSITHHQVLNEKNGANGDSLRLEQVLQEDQIIHTNKEDVHAMQHVVPSTHDVLQSLDETSLLQGKEDHMIVLVPEKPVAGEKCRIYFNRKRSGGLKDRPQILLEGAFNGWMWGNLTVDLLPSTAHQAENAEWWMCEFVVPPEAYDMQFVLHDHQGLYENNMGENFVFDVLDGLSPEEFERRLEELEEEQKQKERDEQERAAKLAADAKRAELEAQDGYLARDEILSKYQEAIRIIAEGRALTENHLWRTFPCPLRPGRKAKIYFNMGCSFLNDGPLNLHYGVNCWWEHGAEATTMKDAAATRTANKEIYMFPDGSSVDKAGDQQWYYTEVDVPQDALTFDFVVSDTKGVFDNNGASDFHVFVQDESLLEPYLSKVIEQRTTEIREARLKAEAEEEERQRLRKLRKEKMKEEALATFRKQQMHIYYTKPEIPIAGQKVTVYYNPTATILNGRQEIYMRGGWNRWKHSEIISPVKMAPCEDTGVCSFDHLQATLTVPNDAFMLDLVFSDSPDTGGNVMFDNRGGLDYHIPVQSSTKKEPPMHIVHVAVEMAPICKVGGLGDVVTSISRAVKDLGHRVEVVVPKYDVIDYSQVQNLREIEGYQWGNCYNHVYHGIVEGLDVYFIDPDNGFFRAGCIYGADWLPIPMTDSERFGFFSRSSLEFLLQSGRQPDIIHCHDWSSAPVARAYWENYHGYGLGKPKIAFTIHNLNYGAGLISEAISYCQKATTVSPTYAKEVSSNPSVAHGVHAGKFYGIRNGIDLDIWDPEGDKFLPVPYSSQNCVEGKAAAKKALRERLNLAQVDCPLIGVVTRLTAQKGMHLIEHAIYTSISRGCQFVLLGSAFDAKVQQHWNGVASRLSHEHHHMVRLHFEYNEPLSHLVYAGADMLLVPSIFEPCGLSQLIAMRYGTVPIVRKTGGLYDTVFDVDHDKARADWEMRETNGFNFDGADPAGVDYAVHRAIDRWYTDKDWWEELVSTDMEQDWSWNRPAIDYIELYHAAIHTS